MVEVNDNLYSKKENQKISTAINFLIALTMLVLVLEILFSISYSGIYVIGRSMNDTLTGAEEQLVDEVFIADTDGDYVYVNKNKKPDYGNIVVVVEDDKTTIIKRVIAKGGDYVKIDRGKVYIRHSADEEFPEEPVKEDYVNPENNSPTNINNTFYNTDEGFLVEDGCYFLLGDNRNVSLDSRKEGGTCFSEKQIYGVVTDWSLNGKSLFTKLHKFFSFKLPDFFGIDNRVKRQKTI